ncbi:MAG TPA: hypothetical protein PLA25_13395, partial [Anaerolineaceae bacterium]|nr:hypothetical protein [Anaerolineaceae bacterium]
GAILTSIYRPEEADTLFSAVQAGLLVGAGLALAAAGLAAMREKVIQASAAGAALTPDAQKPE